MANQALPPSTHRLLVQHLERCKNLGLLLDKHAPWQEVRAGRNGQAPQWSLVIEQADRRGIKRVDEMNQAKTKWLTTFRRAEQGETPHLFDVPRLDLKLLEAQHARFQTAVDSTPNAGRFQMQTSAALVVGLGASHVLETALTLDRNSGAPIIPGSTIKGVARAMALFQLAHGLGVGLDQVNKLDDELMKAPPTQHRQNKQTLSEHDAKEKHYLEILADLFPKVPEIADEIHVFRALFGHQGYGGAVVFWDAVCATTTRQDLFTTEVMTPHYVKYYRGSNFPSDDDSPTPIGFLAVRAGVVFEFGLSVRPGGNIGLLRTAKDTLELALSSLGIGGKNSSGYGFFKETGDKRV